LKLIICISFGAKPALDCLMDSVPSPSNCRQPALAVHHLPHHPPLLLPPPSPLLSCLLYSQRHCCLPVACPHTSCRCCAFHPIACSCSSALWRELQGR
jgi:hypothetical protein